MISRLPTIMFNTTGIDEIFYCTLQENATEGIGDAFSIELDLPCIGTNINYQSYLQVHDLVSSIH